MSIDMAQFHQVFFEESFEGLQIMESGLLNLDLGAADTETINTIFRAAHSIKGGGGTFGFTEVSNFTHVLETLLDEMRDGRREVSQAAVNLLLKSVDCLREMLTAVQAGDAVDEEGVSAVQAELELLLGATGEMQSSAEDVAAAHEGAGWKIRFAPHQNMLRTGNDSLRLVKELAALGRLEVVSDLSGLPTFAELDPESSYLSWTFTLEGEVTREQITEIFEWVEDDCELDISPIEAPALVTASASEPAGPVKAAPVAEDKRIGEEERRKGDKRGGASQEASSIRVGTDKIDSLINKVGELVITQSMLGQFGEEFDVSQLERLRDGLAQLERNTRELQEGVMQIRMLPISFSFSRFPRLVHDLSSKLGKKVELKLSGESTEVDKTVLEKIGDPLVHLVRNSLDHGLEDTETRRAAGKSEVGTIHLNAFHQGGEIVLEVSDDGAGLNAEKLLAKAIERGLATESDELSEEQIYNLIFLPGFSTATEVSDVSGRGVGMDVVCRNINDLGGKIGIRSELGAGTTITIRLPLTLAILDGQLVRVGRETYVLSLLSIIESLQVEEHLVSEVAGKAELYKVRGEFIPIIRLYEACNIEPDSTDLTAGLLVIVEADGRRVGLFVDDLLGQQQVVIKSLEKNYQHVQGLSGATILGDGTVALILDPPGLVRSFFQADGSSISDTLKVA